MHVDTSASPESPFLTRHTSALWLSGLCFRVQGSLKEDSIVKQYAMAKNIYFAEILRGEGSVSH